MPKANVTYEEVAAFCESHVLQGNSPEKLSCRIIADGLGCSSSYGTISGLLKEWHAQRAQVDASSVIITDLDLGPVVQQVRQLVAIKCAESKADSAERLEAFSHRLKGTADDLQLVRSENERLKEEITKFEAIVDEQARTIASLRRAVDLLDPDNRVQVPVAPVAPAAVAAAALSGTTAEPLHQRLGLAEIAPNLPAQGRQPEALKANIARTMQPVRLPASNSDDLLSSAAIANSNTGTEEKPHVQG